MTITMPFAPGAINEPWVANRTNHLICKECREEPPNIIEEYSSGDMVCGDCGLVLDHGIVDTRSEWRTFSNDDSTGPDPSRVGDAINLFLHSSQLQTFVAPTAGSEAHRDLARAQAKSTENKADTSLREGYSHIVAYAAATNLQENVVTIAKDLYMRASHADNIKGKVNLKLKANLPAVAGGCLFIACRQVGHARTFREIFPIGSRLEIKTAGRVFKALETFFKDQVEDAKANNGPETGYKTGTKTTGKDLMTRYCNNLGLERWVGLAGEALADRITELGNLDGRAPNSKAAACIYMLSHLLGMGLNIKQICQKLGVTPGTVDKGYNILYADREKIVGSVSRWFQNGVPGALPWPKVPKQKS